MALEFTGLGRSLSRFELMVSIILIMTLVALGIGKMLLLAAYAERQFMESTVININTALRYRAGLYQLRGQWKALAAMQGMNPFSLMTAKPVFAGEGPAGADKILEDYSNLQVLNLPSRYLGELDAADPADLDSGYWYYDKTAKTLVYIVNNAEFFTSALDGPARVRYRVTVDYRDNNNNGRYDPGVDDFTGVELKNLGDYQWAR